MAPFDGNYLRKKLKSVLQIYIPLFLALQLGLPLGVAYNWEFLENKNENDYLAGHSSAISQ